MPFNKQNQTWFAVEEHAEARLSELRDELETSECSERRSDELRGAIDELKQLLRLGDPPRPLQTSGGVSPGINI